MDNLKNTFCNPFVLPDYPLLASRRHGLGGTGQWDREGKTFTSDREFIRAKYPEYHGGLMDDWHGHAGLGTGVSDRGFGIPNAGGPNRPRTAGNNLEYVKLKSIRRTVSA